MTKCVVVVIAITPRVRRTVDRVLLRKIVNQASLDGVRGLDSRCRHESNATSAASLVLYLANDTGVSPVNVCL